MQSSDSVPWAITSHDHCIKGNPVDAAKKRYDFPSVSLSNPMVPSGHEYGFLSDTNIGSAGPTETIEFCCAPRPAAIFASCRERHPASGRLRSKRRLVNATRGLTSGRTDRTAIISKVSCINFWSTIQLPSLRFFSVNFSSSINSEAAPM